MNRALYGWLPVFLLLAVFRSTAIAAPEQEGAVTGTGRSVIKRHPKYSACR